MLEEEVGEEEIEGGGGKTGGRGSGRVKFGGLEVKNKEQEKEKE